MTVDYAYKFARVASRQCCIPQLNIQLIMCIRFFLLSSINFIIETSTGPSASSPGHYHSQKRQALHNVYLILSRRLLHCPNIKPTLAERLISLEKQFIMVLIRAQAAIAFRQTAVIAYFRSTKLLLFALARQRIGGDKLNDV